MISRFAYPARPRLALVGLLAWPIFGACGDPAEPTSGAGTLGWTEDLRIGSVDEEEYAFTYITDVSVGPEERIYVAQWQVPEVWIFEADGTPAGRLGGGGEGPGEFAAIGYVGWMGDTLWVTDISSAITLFDRTGRFLDRIHYSAPFPEGSSGFRPIRPLADGTFLTSAGFTTDAVLRRGLDRVPYLRSRRDGTTIDTLAWRSLRREVLQVDIGGGGFVHTPHPFAGSTIVTTDPGVSEVVQVDPEPVATEVAFRLGRIAITGDTLLWRMIPYDPIPISDEAVEALIASSYAESMQLQDRMTLLAYEDAYLEGLERPSTFPPVSQVEVDHDGAIWVRREATQAETIRWEIYTPDGELFGGFDLPAQFRVITVHEGSLWAVDTDELDIQYLVRLRIEPARPDS